MADVHADADADAEEKEQNATHSPLKYHVSQEGHGYYYNEETGESQWADRTDEEKQDGNNVTENENGDAAVVDAGDFQYNTDRTNGA